MVGAVCEVDGVLKERGQSVLGMFMSSARTSSGRPSISYVCGDAVRWCFLGGYEGWSECSPTQG